MSRNLEEAKLSVISDINKIFKENKHPILPIDENPIQGDISIICFPGAQSLKKSPEEVAKNVSEMISHIKLIKETFVVKAFCNIVLDWDFLFEDIFGEINNSEYGRGVSKPDSILLEHTSANATGPFHMGRARKPNNRDSVSRLRK